MEPTEYTVEKLVMSRRFQRWVKRPNRKLEAFWSNWVAEKPGREALVEEARQIVLSLAFPDNLTEAEIAQEWQKIQPLAVPFAAKEETRTSHRSRILTVPGYWQAAAVFIGLLVCSGLVYLFLAQPADVQFATGNGEIKTVTLPDGSTATLNANSELSFPPVWEAGRPREVRLKGEAFFSVTHRANQKFTVLTSDPFRVEVLGTTFTVLDRADRNRVVLRSGKVRLQTGIAGQSRALELQPGDLVEVAENSVRPVRKRVNPAVYAAFKDGKLLFDNTPLSEIARTLEETYGLKVHLPDAQIAAREFTGTFPLNDLPLLLQVLGRTYHLDMLRDGKELWMRPKTSLHH